VFHPDLYRLADWLQQCGVTTVALQSTGVYWIPIYEILDARGFEVYLVNARHTKNLPGRKTDVQESQWLLKLHTYGLLRNSFHPSAAIRIMRTYWRQRGDHVHAVSTCLQRMQKVLTQMNIQLANVISDLSGWTGQRIVRAILAGERDPQTLAGLSHPGIHATRDAIAKSLEGTWQPDLLFVLQQEVTMYDAYEQRIAECDQELERHLKRFTDKTPDTAPASQSPAPAPPGARVRVKRRRKAGSHTPQFDLGHELQRITGVDLTQIDGIDVGGAETVISEAGLEMTRWHTEAHFASWLGLCPDNRITGGKVRRRGTRHVINRAATALRLAATTLLRSQSYLGAQYRRLRARLGAPKAITAMAHKLARLVYRMLKWGHEYVDKGLQYYEQRHRQQQVHLLKKRAAKLGLQIIEPEVA
jgi:transposase